MYPTSMLNSVCNFTGFTDLLQHPYNFTDGAKGAHDTARAGTRSVANPDITPVPIAATLERELLAAVSNYLSHACFLSTDTIPMAGLFTAVRLDPVLDFADGLGQKLETEEWEDDCCALGKAGILIDARHFARAAESARVDNVNEYALASSGDAAEDELAADERICGHVVAEVVCGRVEALGLGDSVNEDCVEVGEGVCGDGDLWAAGVIDRAGEFQETAADVLAEGSEDDFGVDFDLDGQELLGDVSGWNGIGIDAGDRRGGGHFESGAGKKAEESGGGSEREESGKDDGAGGQTCLVEVHVYCTAAQAGCNGRRCGGGTVSRHTGKVRVGKERIHSIFIHLSKIS